MFAAERQQFLKEYGHIRSAEGRGADDAEYYTSLPYVDRARPNADQWAIRARSFEYFERHILPATPLDILDLGAGNCWLSYRLAQRHHRPVAVDIFTDTRDGLGAATRYPVRFVTVEAEFDSLPFPSASFDMAVFASSFHYSTDYARTLREVRRCLRPGGKVTIIDSPVYRLRAHGKLMVAERHAFFEKTYGFRSDTVASKEYLDRQTLRDLSNELGIEWRVHRPWYGWQWHLRPWKAKLRGKRPPSNFWILVAEFQPS